MKSTSPLYISVALVIGLSSMTATALDCVRFRNGRVVCQQPDSRCVRNHDGEIFCSTPGGGIEFDLYGVPVCGPGYCVRGRSGDVVCSSQPRGPASTDQYGTPVCSVSCVPADKAACVKLEP
ncbi:MAG: hypothetical protein LBI87_07335 [Candidatus Accumulibacter sp.]|nr:hypothetical protein [Accumulibacter sp.]